MGYISSYFSKNNIVALVRRDIFLGNIRAYTQVRQVGIYSGVWTTTCAYSEVLLLRRPGNTTSELRHKRMCLMALQFTGAAQVYKCGHTFRHRAYKCFIYKIRVYEYIYIRIYIYVHTIARESPRAQLGHCWLLAALLRGNRGQLYVGSLWFLRLDNVRLKWSRRKPWNTYQSYSWGTYGGIYIARGDLETRVPARRRNLTTRNWDFRRSTTRWRYLHDDRSTGHTIWRLSLAYWV